MLVHTLQYWVSETKLHAISTTSDHFTRWQTRAWIIFVMARRGARKWITEIVILNLNKFYEGTHGGYWIMVAWICRISSRILFRRTRDVFLASMELLFGAVDDVLDVVFFLMAAIERLNYKNCQLQFQKCGFRDQRSHSCPLRASLCLGVYGHLLWSNRTMFMARMVSMDALRGVE